MSALDHRQDGVRRGAAAAAALLEAVLAVGSSSGPGVVQRGVAAAAPVHPEVEPVLLDGAEPAQHLLARLALPGRVRGVQEAVQLGNKSSGNEF